MARILKSGKRRIIKLSTDDIISVIQSYQQMTYGCRDIETVRDILSDRVMFLPESD